MNQKSPTWNIGTFFLPFVYLVRGDFFAPRTLGGHGVGRSFRIFVVLNQLRATWSCGSLLCFVLKVAGQLATVRNETACTGRFPLCDLIAGD